MKLPIHFLLIFFLALSCSNQKNIEQFEKTLGKANADILTELVQDFENDFLKIEYPNLSTKKAYRAFLKQLNTGDTTLLYKMPKKIIDKFYHSSLKLEIYSTLDSIWIERNQDSLGIQRGFPSIFIKRKNETIDGSYAYSITESFPRHTNHLDKDSLINYYQNVMEISYTGRYSSALNSIPKKTKFTEEYFELRNKAGKIAPNIIASQMINYDVNLDDYIIKRLILTEIVF